MSPASPPRAEPDLELLPPRLSKEELIQSMDRVDREITMVEQQISKLKRKQVAAGPGAVTLDAGHGLGSTHGPASLGPLTFVARGAVLCVWCCLVGLSALTETFSGYSVQSGGHTQLGTEPLTLIRIQCDGPLN